MNGSEVLLDTFYPINDHEVMMKIRQSAAFLFLILTGVSRAAPVIHTDFKPAQHPLLILVKGYSVTAVGVGLNDDNGSTDPGGNESTDPGGNESTDPGGNEGT